MTRKLGLTSMMEVKKMSEKWTPKNLDKQVREILTNSGYDVDELIQNKDKHYRVFSIPKRDGSKRMITAPDKKMKCALNCVKGILEMVGPFPSPYAHGFKRRRSPITNAKVHQIAGAKAMVIMDLKNFFPSISQERITALYGPLVGELCTFHGRAGQGLPTSPWISNVVLVRMDYEIANWCNKQSPKTTYTRYADDITISCVSKDVDLGHIKSIVRRIIRRHGFEIKPQKTRMQRPHRRMMVTGVVINEKVGVSRTYRRNVRAAIHQLQFKENVDPKEIEKLKGKISWIYSANHDQGVKLSKQLDEYITRQS